MVGVGGAECAGGDVGGIMSRDGVRGGGHFGLLYL